MLPRVHKTDIFNEHDFEASFGVAGAAWEIASNSTPLCEGYSAGRSVKTRSEAFTCLAQIFSVPKNQRFPEVGKQVQKQCQPQKDDLYPDWHPSNILNGVSFLEFYSIHLYIYPTPSPPYPTTTEKLYLSLMATQNRAEFRDYLPTMAEKLGGEALIGELCNGFQLLMDKDKGLITFESLKRNSGLLGLEGLSDDELWSMLQEGDTDGDGALSQMEFCVLMFRLSPDLMEESQRCLEEALEHELSGL